MDGISQEYESWFRDLIQNKVPDFLARTCQEFTFAQDIGKYITDKNAHRYTGYSTGTRVYVTLGADLSEMEYTDFHELGHCYDFIQNTSTQVITQRDGDRYASYGLGQFTDVDGMFINLFSASAKWKAICEKEAAAVSQWYAQDLFWGFDAVQRRKEAFAISVGKYFTDPDWFMKQCPEMYAYMDNLFRQQLAPEETEPTP